MAKNNKLPPKKNAAAKSVSAKTPPSKTVAKPAKVSPVAKAAAPSKTASPAANSKKSAPAKTSAARSPAKAAPAPAKPAAKPVVKASAPAVKPAPAKQATGKPAPSAAVVKAQPAKVMVGAGAGKVGVAAQAATAANAHAQQRAMPANGAKSATATLSSPVQHARPVPPAVGAQPKQVQPAAAQAVDPNAPKKTITSRHGFKTNELIVYPAHGVGRIIGIEEQEIAGISLELFVIEFEKDKMTLRVPTSKLVSVGMRKLAEDGVLKKAMETLKGKARIKRTMWSRRAQEYEAKINSGDLVAIAEVVRDLYRSEAQPEQSYSERQLYEAALDRMSRELAAVDKSDERSAMQRITEILAKSAKGRRAVEDAQANASANEGEVKAA